MTKRGILCLCQPLAKRANAKNARFGYELVDISGHSGCRLADEVVSKGLVTAVAVGLVVTVFALAQVVILAFIAGKSLRSELAALMGTIAEGLLATLATGAEKIFAIFFQCDFAGAVGCDCRLFHIDLRWQRSRRLHYGCKLGL